MTGIILELQKEATDANVRISDLLRKALLVAKKLKITEIEQWLMSELNGYDDGADIPQYRHVNGQIKAFNTYNGVWMPVMFAEGGAEKERILSQRMCGQAVSQLEALIDDNPEQVGMQYSPEIQARLMKGADLPFPPMLIVSVSHLHGILDSVRTSVLEWALKLEEEGIVGEGLSFSDAEKEAASSVTINVENMTGSQIQAGTSNSSQSMTSTINIQQINDFVKQLEESLPDLALDDDTAQEVSSEIATIKAQVSSPKPKEGIIKSSLGTIKRVLEGAAGNMTAQGLMRLIENITVF